VPIQPFAFADIAQRALHTGWLVSSWFADRWGCSGTPFTAEFYGIDYLCTMHTAKKLSYNRIDWSRKRTEQFQSMFNNWWVYTPEVMLRAMSRVEDVTGLSYAQYVYREQTDGEAHFYGIYATAEARKPLTNVLEQLEKRFPDTFASCCACTAKKPTAKCWELSHMFTDCFNVPSREMGRFLAEDLGVSGIFGNLLGAGQGREADRILEAVDAEPRLSWCINNCFRPQVQARFRGHSTLAYGLDVWRNITGIDINTSSVF